ncbi:MAG: hypothetical protein ACYTGN_11400 [Planctomycetota bacterium]|jgi:hypothetical protein
MRAYSPCLLALALLAPPVLAIDIVELKNGKLYQVESAQVRNGKLAMKLATSKSQKVGFSVPLDRVVPEFVYYAWEAQIEKGDVDQHIALADWARKNGLFGPAWAQYELAAGIDPGIHSKLPKIEGEMYEEQATWIFESAERLFKVGDIKSVRKRLEVLLKKFDKSKEVGRAKALYSILDEREQFLSEQKKQEKVANRARKQQRRIDKYLDLIDRADHLVKATRIGYDHYNARRRLHWAAYAYRKAFFVFDEMELDVEVDDLRKRLKSLKEVMESRIVRTFLKLADLHWVMGDAGNALGAVHEVMMVDPANEAALGLRERILEEPTVVTRERIPEYPYNRRQISRAHLGRGRNRYPLMYGGQFGFGSPYFGRHRWFSMRVH